MVSIYNTGYAEDFFLNPLAQIWNTEVIDNENFQSKLKYADITAIFKKLECIFVKDYRPVKHITYNLQNL